MQLTGRTPSQLWGHRSSGTTSLGRPSPLRQSWLARVAAACHQLDTAALPPDHHTRAKHPSPHDPLVQTRNPRNGMFATRGVWLPVEHGSEVAAHSG